MIFDFRFLIFDSGLDPIAHSEGNSGLSGFAERSAGIDRRARQGRAF